jgi:hypothetical protein
VARACRSRFFFAPEKDKRESSGATLPELLLMNPGDSKLFPLFFWSLCQLGTRLDGKKRFAGGDSGGCPRLALYVHHPARPTGRNCLIPPQWTGRLRLLALALFFLGVSTTATRLDGKTGSLPETEADSQGPQEFRIKEGSQTLPLKLRE